MCGGRDWIDYERWPGPDELDELEQLKQYVIVSQKVAKALAENMGMTFAAVSDALKKMGVVFAETAAGAKPVVTVIPPKIPTHVGPRPKRTFGRRGKRNF